MNSSSANRLSVHRMVSHVAPSRPNAIQMRRPAITTKLRRYKSDVADRSNHFTATGEYNGTGAGVAGSSNWATMHQGPPNVAISRLTEDWIKLQRRIDLWVAIEELTEDVSTFMQANINTF